jgi:UDP-glucose 4-epimerase
METNKKHILVTGGSGYIGSHTVLALIESGFKVTIFDKQKPNAVFEKWISKTPNCKYIKGNLLDLRFLKKVLSDTKYDGVIHFAADPAFVSQEPKFTSGYYTNNVVSAINLISACQECRINNFVFSSTAAIYGIPNKLPITEDSELRPINVYGYTKSVIETMLTDYAHAYNFSSIRLRYFNACGGDKECRTGEIHEPEVHLIPNILKSVGSDKEFSLFGDNYKTKDGTNVRDYIHVTDLSSAHVLGLQYLIDSKETVKEVVNLGTGSGYSNLEIFQTAEKVLGQKIPLKISSRRAGDPDELVADNKKAKKLLKWKPTHSSLENIIKTAWNWEQLTKQR